MTLTQTDRDGTLRTLRSWLAITYPHDGRHCDAAAENLLAMIEGGHAHDAITAERAMYEARLARINALIRHDETKGNSSVERHTLRTVGEAIRRRVDFRCNNTLSGHNGYATSYTGELPRAYREAYDRARQRPDFYVVHSYVTPIAWYADGRWTRPPVRYSRTTSRHQGKTPQDGTTT